MRPRSQTAGLACAAIRKRYYQRREDQRRCPSPDFNPIELAFAKLKAFLRAARPRSFDQVVELVAIALRLFTPQECLNFVRHCGYRVATAL
jgi:hypothetical protein